MGGNDQSGRDKLKGKQEYNIILHGPMLWAANTLPPQLCTLSLFHATAEVLLLWLPPLLLLLQVQGPLSFALGSEPLDAPGASPGPRLTQRPCYRRASPAGAGCPGGYRGSTALCAEHQLMHTLDISVVHSACSVTVPPVAKLLRCTRHVCLMLLAFCCLTARCPVWLAGCAQDTDAADHAAGARD